MSGFTVEECSIVRMLGDRRLRHLAHCAHKEAERTVLLLRESDQGYVLRPSLYSFRTIVRKMILPRLS